MKNYLLILLALAVSCAHHKPSTISTQHVKHQVSHKAAPVRAVASQPSESSSDLEEETILDDVKDLFSRKTGFFNNPDKAVVFSLIKDAKKSVDIEIYEMKDEDFKDLLLEKLDQKVKVRIIKDPFTVGDSCDELAPDDVLPANPKSQSSCLEEKKYVQHFIAKGGKYVYFNKKELCGIPGKSCFEHGKMVIVDQKVLMLSTGNFNSSNLCNVAQNPAACNRDFSYVSKDSKVIDLLSDVYNHDFAGVAYDLKGIMDKSKAKNITISPFSRGPIVNFINQAKKKLLIQNQYLEDPAWNEAIVNAAKRGVDVQVMVTDFCNFGEPRDTKKDKITDIYTQFDQAGIKTKIFTANIKIRNRPGYLHAKAFVVDDKMAWVGSVNGSVMSNTQNREYGIFFNRHRSVKKLIKVIEEDMNHPQAVSWQKSLACEK